jgi:DNA-binding response OmpR family regulator
VGSHNRRAVGGKTIVARILIVEDDRAFAEVLALALRVAGHDVRVATSADEGLRLGTDFRPDVVIADWMLHSDLHGGDVCRRMRAVCPAVKTIIVTGYLDIAPEVGRWSEYGEIMMQKPFHKEDLLATVNRMLSCPAVR